MPPPVPGAASTLVIMDQRAGDGGKFTEVQDNGETAYYSGRPAATVTFALYRPLAVLRLVTVGKDGVEKIQNRKLFRRDDFLNGQAYAFPLQQFAAALRADKGTTVKVEAVTADGAAFTPVTFTVG